MKIVVAPDSFKGSLTAGEACEAIRLGVLRAAAGAEVVLVPMADGGEGTVDALVASTDGERRELLVTGPLGEPVMGFYGILGDGHEGGVKTAVIEMAAAAGLPSVPELRRNPLETTTYGFGELILDAYKQGCREFVVGLGGSATNDCGTGMAQALGVVFYGLDGEVIEDFMTGGLMGQVSRVDVGDLVEGLADCEIVAACDVENPLLGETGATRVYGPQKGADAGQLLALEANMAVVIDLIERSTGRAVRESPGAGAAGGLGAGLMAFLGARLERGVEIVMRQCGFEDKIRGADLIITGEGRVDGSTAYGKTISGIVSAGRRQSVPVVALAGSVGSGYEKVLEIGVCGVFGICSGPMSLAEAMRDGGRLLSETAEQVVRLYRLSL